MATDQSTQHIIQVSGMTCPACAYKVTKAIQTVEGIQCIQVTVDKSQAVFTSKGHPDSATEAVISAIENAGYGATAASSDSSYPSSSDSDWARTVYVGASITALLMIGEWGLRLGHESWFQYTAFLLSSIVQIYCGGRFYRGAWRQLQRGASNMDTLVAIGSTTAFGFSIWGLFTGWSGHLYFMESAAIISLVSLGHYIESRVATRAESSLNSLLKLTPETALKRNIDGSEAIIPVDQLKPSNEVILKPGDKIPVDGKVLEGTSSIDESMLTGESLPVNKGPGDKILAGTNNLDGTLVMQVTATGTGTALARIIEIVKRAQSSHANIQRLGDKVSSIFVPIVILIAIATALWWGLAYESALKTATTLLPFLTPEHFPSSPLEAAFIHLAGVLIIACPCAMGLATPVAIMAGVNAAARRGILIRDGAALEKSGTITTVAFDKTGTLTTGHLSVDTDTTYSRDIRNITSKLTKGSRHPISRTLFEHFDTGSQGPKVAFNPEETTRPTDMRHWIEVRGRGIQAVIGYCTYRLGSLNWLHEFDVIPDEKTAAEIKRLQANGRTVVALAREGELLQIFPLRDKLKPDASTVIRTLRERKLTPAMITGDNAGTALAIAREATIDEVHVHANVLPEEKANIIKHLQKGGERTAFVGDGINDAPALEQADLGIAVTQASDIAMESADIILLQSDIQAIPEAIALSQATLRTIKQNLFWAFFYNAAAIPLAVLGLVSPVICAAAMGFSDLIVIGNALRLLRRCPKNAQR